jgi:hypothetical protein
MPLSDNDIRLISRWQPIRESFGRSDARTGARVRGIVDGINAAGDFRCKMLADDGVGNYFTLFAFNSSDARRLSLSKPVDGLLIYLSACAPVGVFGRSQRVEERLVCWHDPLELGSLISPEHLGDPLVEAVVNAIRRGGYEVLSPAEASRPLPAGIEPYEYCYSEEPWDRVFHALFANSD